MSLATDAMEQAVSAMTERLDKELRGAYRAGYDYLYVGNPRTPLVQRGDVQSFKLRLAVMPSNSEQSPLPEREYVVSQYDLTDLHPAEYRDIIEEHY